MLFRVARDPHLYPPFRTFYMAMMPDDAGVVAITKQCRRGHGQIRERSVGMVDGRKGTHVRDDTRTFVSISCYLYFSRARIGYPNRPLVVGWRREPRPASYQRSLE